MATRGGGRPLTGSVALRLMNGFELSVRGAAVALPRHGQRVLAYLAVTQREQPRQALAGRLWGDVPQTRSNASLRTALWHIRRAHPDLVRTTRDLVRLNGKVEVDLHRIVEQAEWLLSDEPGLREADAAVGALEADLLPDWDEDWLLIERERLRQLRLHALEALSSRLLAAGRLAHAIQSAHAAVAAEPLRESAWATLIEAHLQEGNLGEAARELDRFSVLLWSELRARPSADLARRVADAITATRSVQAVG